jgi:agmatine/peptidylarginine deiminase
MPIARQLGFTAAVLLSFVAGSIWALRNAEKGDPPVAEHTLIPASGLNRFGTLKSEPEDFYPVAEFRQQAAIILGCHGELNTNPQLYMDIARAINGRTPLFGFVSSGAQARTGVELLRKNGLPADAIRFVSVPANTIWIRDYSPFMVRRQDNSIALVDARYIPGISGEKMRAFDDEVASHFASMLGLPIRSMPISADGGNLLSNGDGAVISTSEILLANQLLGYSKDQITDILTDMLGVRLWSFVPPLEGEATGHVDMFATFLAKNIVVVGQIAPETDPVNSARLDMAARHFQSMTTSLGPMKVVRIPMPSLWNNMWRSYTNIILANGILLMPSFSDIDPEMEDQIEETYQALLPGWEIKRILCDGLVQREGQLHCISYNLPKYVNLDGLYENAYPIDGGKLTSRPP